MNGTEPVGGLPPGDPVDFDLSRWPASDRAALMAAVATEHISYRLVGDRLHVPDRDADRALDLLAEYSGEGGRAGVELSYDDRLAGGLGGRIASRGSRVGGYLIDVVVFRMLSIAVLTVWFLTREQGHHIYRGRGPGWALAFFAVLSTVTLVPLLLWRGTLGMLIVGNRVADMPDLGRASTLAVTVRWLLPALCTALTLAPAPAVFVALAGLALTFAPVCFRADRRGLHDLLSGTTVVTASRG